MRLALLVSVAVLAPGLAGCAALADDFSVDAPTWKAGERWRYEGSVQGSAVYQAPGEEPEVEDIDETLSIAHTVLVPSVATSYGELAILLQENREFSFLAASRPGDLARVPSDWYAAPLGCADADLCHPPIAADLYEPDEDEVLFPLKDGSRWSSTDEDGAFTRTSRVVGRSGGLVQVRYTVEANETAAREDLLAGRPGGELDFRFLVRQDEWYDPDEGKVVRAEWKVDIDLHATGGGVDDTIIQEKVEGSVRMVEHDRIDVDLEALLPGLGLGGPVGGPLPRDLGILPHPDRFEAGKTWTFEAGTLAAGTNATLHWSLVLDPAVTGQAVAGGEGPRFPVTFAQPGWYDVRLEARAGDNVVARASSMALVDLRLTGQGACAQGLSTVVLPDALCDGLTFDLPPSPFRVTATADYALGQAAIPCPALVLHKDGEEELRNYAWPQLPAELTALVQGPGAFEVRWEPASSLGEPVEYEVLVEALGPGGYSEPGTRAC